MLSAALFVCVFTLPIAMAAPALTPAPPVLLQGTTRWRSFRRTWRSSRRRSRRPSCASPAARAARAAHSFPPALSCGCGFHRSTSIFNKGEDTKIWDGIDWTLWSR